MSRLLLIAVSLLSLFPVDLSVDPNSITDLNLSAIKCRDRKDYNYPTIKNYIDYQCLQCYKSLVPVAPAWPEPDTGRKWIFRDHLFPYDKTKKYHIRACYNESGNDCRRRDAVYYSFEFLALKRNKPEEDTFMKNFSSSFFVNLFLRCCDDALACCNHLRQLPDHEVNPTNSSHCPAKWDAWVCWDATPAGTIAFRKCPAISRANYDYVPAHCSMEYAFKQCMPNGTWYRRMYLDKNEWTNYYPCVSQGIVELIRQCNVQISMSAVSLFLTIIGVVIFVYYKQYRVVRVQIHLNFFASLILSSIFDILFLSLVRLPHYKEIASSTNSPPWCILILVLKKTSRLANYFWMFIEGVYLHKLIVAAFKEQTNVKYFLIIGWLSPVGVMVIYCIIHSLSQYNQDCWTKSMNQPEWIFNVFPLFCILTNIILLANIIRVLMCKLLKSPDHFKAGVRASLLLLPIFGVQYSFYFKDLDPLEECNWFSFGVRYIKIIVEGLQGAFVTTVFCFLNAEVHDHIRRSCRRHFHRISNAKSTATEEQEVTTI